LCFYVYIPIIQARCARLRVIHLPTPLHPATSFSLSADCKRTLRITACCSAPHMFPSVHFFRFWQHSLLHSHIFARLWRGICFRKFETALIRISFPLRDLHFPLYLGHGEDLYCTLSILLSAEALCFAPRIRQIGSRIVLIRHLSQSEITLLRDKFSRGKCLQLLHQRCQHRARAIMRRTVWHEVTSPLWSSFYAELKMDQVQSCAAFLSSTGLTVLLPPHPIHTSEHILATEHRLTFVHRRQQLRFYQSSAFGTEGDLIVVALCFSAMMFRSSPRLSDMMSSLSSKTSTAINPTSLVRPLVTRGRPVHLRRCWH